MDIAEKVAKYGATWSEPDADARRKLLTEVWAEDGLYIDPTARVEGLEALVAHTGGFQQAMAGHRIDATSGVDTHGGYFRFAWKMYGPDGNELLEGVDFGRLDDDGKIKLICGFFGPWPEAQS